jgi:hypothetical protein
VAWGKRESDELSVVELRAFPFERLDARDADEISRSARSQ